MFVLTETYCAVQNSNTTSTAVAWIIAFGIIIVGSIVAVCLVKSFKRR